MRKSEHYNRERIPQQAVAVHCGIIERGDTMI
jgi:hypothetical protein